VADSYDDISTVIGWSAQRAGSQGEYTHNILLINTATVSYWLVF
jgi:hypothetical protein